jgi:hypothetical protein
MSARGLISEPTIGDIGDDAARPRQHPGDSSISSASPR